MRNCSILLKRCIILALQNRIRLQIIKKEKQIPFILTFKKLFTHEQ